MPPPSTRDPHGQPSKGRTRTRDEWVALASAAILYLLDEHLVIAGTLELEARLATRRAGQLSFDPHILTLARTRLLADKSIRQIEHVSRGGGPATLLVVADSTNRQTAITKATSRKALLYRRYIALIDTAGEAGELVVRHSLLQAREAGQGYQPVASKFKETPELLGVRPYGSLDSAAFLHTTDQGIPQRPAALPIEVKNRRLTIYPIHKELHQLLAKATAIQAAHPDYPLVPTLVCRSAHPRTFWMAQDLGFRISTTHDQFVFTSKDIPADKIEEIRDELALSYLKVVDRKAPPRIVDFFMKILPNSAISAAGNWGLYAPIIAPFADALRRDNMDPHERQTTINALHDEITELHENSDLDPPNQWAVRDDLDH